MGGVWRDRGSRVISLVSEKVIGYIEYWILVLDFKIR